MLWLTAQILIKNERMGPKTRNYSDKCASQHEYSDFRQFLAKTKMRFPGK